jgi:hypothetical protein
MKENEKGVKSCYSKKNQQTQEDSKRSKKKEKATIQTENN